VGLCTTCIQLTHIVKGFWKGEIDFLIIAPAPVARNRLVSTLEPLNVISWFQAFAFSKQNGSTCTATRRKEKRRSRRGGALHVEII
jgi:hypothetical protein